MFEGYKKILIIGFIFIVLLIVFLTIMGWIKTAHTVLKIESVPAKIGIVINNQEYETPLNTQIKPGTYTIWGFLEGYKTYKKEFKVQSGIENYLKIEMQVETEALPPEGAPTSPEPTPQITNLPYQTDHFKVDWDSAYNKYRITPDIPFTAADSPQNQFKENWNQYEQYGKEALTWIKTQGVQPTEENIEWWGQEWWPEGANLNLDY